MASEEWLEGPTPYGRYLVSTAGRCYDVRRHEFIQRTMHSASPGPAVAVPVFRVRTDGSSGTQIVAVGLMLYRTFYGPVGGGHTVIRIDECDDWHVLNVVRVNTVTRLPLPLPPLRGGPLVTGRQR